MSELPAVIQGKVEHLLPSNLLHDLRTPLGHILGYSELLIEQMTDSGKAEQVMYAEKIRAAGHQLLELLAENFQAR